MKTVWELNSCTVRDVYEALLKRRKVAYTTVMTMMNILAEKGHLTKQRAEKPGDKAYVYVPAKPQKQVIRSMVREFVDRVFNGAAEPLLLHLVEDDQLTAAELDEIRATIRAAESEQKPARKAPRKKGSAR